MAALSLWGEVAAAAMDAQPDERERVALEQRKNLESLGLAPSTATAAATTDDGGDGDDDEAEVISLEQLMWEVDALRDPSEEGRAAAPPPPSSTRSRRRLRRP